MSGVKAAGAWLLLLVVALALSCASVGALTTPTGEITEIKFLVRLEDAGSSKVFGPAPTQNSNKNFGKGEVKDFPVLSLERENEGDSRDSRARSDSKREIGRLRGLFFHDSIKSDGIEHLFSISFEKGKYEGSSLVFAGHAEVASQSVQLPVIGGTGQFGFSHGYAKLDRLVQKRISAQESQENEYEFTVHLKDVSQNEEEERRVFF